MCGELKYVRFLSNKKNNKTLAFVNISSLYLDMHFLPALYCFKVTVMVILSTHFGFITTKYSEIVL